MSSTNKTINYELSQFVGTDKPTWLGDYNSDMAKIDAQMKVNSNAIATAQSTSNTAVETANSANTTANTANTTANTANTNATTSLTKSLENETNISNIKTYSTSEEQEIGIWIDGNKIYRKCFSNQNLVNHMAWTTLFSVTGASKIIDIKAIKNDGEIIIPRYESNEYFACFLTDGTDIKYKCQGISGTYDFIVEYTKQNL